MDNTNNSATNINVDALIIGGGIAGLWTLARLQQAGYKTVLLESDALGAGQTRFAQGIIHGGTKYALTGKLTASSEAVADMPSRWRACYEGNGELDLSHAELLSDAHYLWSTSSLTSRVSGFFASKIMRSRSQEVNATSLPSLFQHKKFKGQFYRLDEPVFNTLSVIRALAKPRQENILCVHSEKIEASANQVNVVSKQDEQYQFHCKKIILMSGQGNEGLLTAFGFQKPEMQRRSLKMVVLRGGLNDMVYAHCLGASVNPRITITSHRDKQGDVVWYMGGQLAEDGVKQSNENLIASAKKELNELIPWLDVSQSQWGVVEIDRAEIKQKGVKRPDSFSIDTSNDVITAWPTKMALAPALADAVTALVDKENIEKNSDQTLPAWGQPEYADFPWDDETVWSARK